MTFLCELAVSLRHVCFKGGCTVPSRCFYQCCRRLSVLGIFFLILFLSAGLQAEDLQADTESSRGGEHTIVELQDTDPAAGDTSDLLLFIGRFHPLFVHLPIGFLLLAILLECVSMFKRYEQLSHAVPFALLMGFMSGIAAGLTGFFLSSGGGYGEELLSRHQWMGISVVVLSFTAFLLRVTLYEKPVYRMLFRITLLVMTGALTGVGHYGGSLTHGSDYLFRYMPEPMRSWVGFEEQDEGEQIALIEDMDNALVYRDIIEPIIKTRCQSCHNTDRTEGDLLLTSFEHLMLGGENGPVVVAHQVEQSELYTRLVLPDRDEERMPPRGRRQLTSDQIKLIVWWINQGLPVTQRVSETVVQGEIAGILDALTVGGQHFFDRVQAARADPEELEKARNHGFHITPIAEGMVFLQVSLPKSKTSISSEDFDILLPLADQITWLDFSRIDVSDSDLSRLSEFFHLTRLRLQHTGISDSTLSEIGTLKHLEYLNLYGTEITDDGLKYLEPLTSLKSLYLWQTNVSDGAVQELQYKLPDSYINHGAGTDSASAAENNYTP